MKLKVRKTSCKTCIYRNDSPLDLSMLENEVADGHAGMNGHRICHHTKTVCCRGFWNKHKDEFPMGQIAQRLEKFTGQSYIEFTDENV